MFIVSICSMSLIHFFVILELRFSASKLIFKDAVRSEHKLSKIIFFLVVKITPVYGALPFVVYSYFMYFTTDLGGDAFDLPAPIW